MTQTGVKLDHFNVVKIIHDLLIEMHIAATSGITI